MFTSDYRETVRNAIIRAAEEDVQILSAASIGSYARNEVDAYSDIDLTFGIENVSTVDQLLAKFKGWVNAEFSGEFLFELRQDETLYGVFLLPGCLQVDLSFTPQQKFGPKAFPFIMLFGEHNGEQAVNPHDPIEDKFGLIAHHLIRAKVCIARQQLDKAKKWLRLGERYLVELSLNEKLEQSDLDQESTLSTEEATAMLFDQIDQLGMLDGTGKGNRIVNMLQDLRETSS